MSSDNVKREACLEIQRRVHEQGQKPELIEGAPTRFEKHEDNN